MVRGEKRIQFWTNRWSLETFLNIALLSMLTVSSAKEAWVGDIWSLEAGGGC